jgi:hypothetical protein
MGAHDRRAQPYPPPAHCDGRAPTSPLAAPSSITSTAGCLGGSPFATPTLWAAIQYLGPHEVAPEHRHSQHAFRFVVEGEGVWTLVNRDPVAMRRGDFLPQAGWNWHPHHNATDQPMAWIDGLDIPFSYYTESQFFQFGADKLEDLPPRNGPEPNGCGPTPAFARGPNRATCLPHRWVVGLPGVRRHQHGLGRGRSLPVQ